MQESVEYSLHYSVSEVRLTSGLQHKLELNWKNASFSTVPTYANNQKLLGTPVFKI